jgi:hypothetical protein
MDQHGTIKEPNIDAHGGLNVMNGDIRVAQQQ